MLKKKDFILMAAIAVSVLTVILVWARWNGLPSEMPAHFDPQGNAAGTMPRAALLLYDGVSVLICVVSALVRFKKPLRRKALSLITLFLALAILCSACVSLTAGRQPLFMFAEPLFVLGIIVTLVVTAVKVRKV